MRGSRSWPSTSTRRENTSNSSRVSPGEASSNGRGEGSIYSTSGRVGLIVDRGVLNLFDDGCRYLRRAPDTLRRDRCRAARSGSRGRTASVPGSPVTSACAVHGTPGARATTPAPGRGDLRDLR